MPNEIIVAIVAIIPLVVTLGVIAIGLLVGISNQVREVVLKLQKVQEEVASINGRLKGITNESGQVETQAHNVDLANERELKDTQSRQLHVKLETLTAALERMRALMRRERSPRPQ